jgi:hypothetical protein
MDGSDVSLRKSLSRSPVRRVKGSICKDVAWHIEHLMKVH